MTIDVQWMIENLATKTDVSRIEETLSEQRRATLELRKTLDIDIAKRMSETDKRVADLENYQRTQQEERREHSRRAEDRRRQWVTWAITLLAPVLVLLTWGWQGLIAVLRALHVIGGK